MQRRRPKSPARPGSWRIFSVALLGALAMTVAACGGGADGSNSAAKKAPKGGEKAAKGDVACMKLWNSGPTGESVRQTLEASAPRPGASPGSGIAITIDGVTVGRVADFNDRCLVTTVTTLSQSTDGGSLGVQLGKQYVATLGDDPRFPWKAVSDIPMNQLPDSAKQFNAHLDTDGRLVAGELAATD